MNSHDIIVTPEGTLRFGGQEYACVVGKGGVTDDKREGDGATPRGRFALREAWYRPDRTEKPATELPLREITPADGWCDDPAHPAYNTHVALPFAARHETLWREDHAYDLLVVLGYNDAPVVAGKGSAIFWHLMHDSGRATEGCVAVTRETMLALLPQLHTATHIHIL